MKTTLLLAAFATSLGLASTTSFAQNYAAYPQVVGDAAVTAAAPSALSYGRFTRSDMSYRGRVTGPTNSAAPPAAAAISGPAPAQQH